MTELESSEHSTWSGLSLNDDYTPMEFVVNAIERFFGMDRESAMSLMLRIHNEGIAECGTYSHEIAKGKAAGWAPLPANIGIRFNVSSSASGKCWPSEAQRYGFWSAVGSQEGAFGADACTH